VQLLPVGGQTRSKVVDVITDTLLQQLLHNIIHSWSAWQTLFLAFKVGVMPQITSMLRSRTSYAMVILLLDIVACMCKQASNGMQQHLAAACVGRQHCAHTHNPAANATKHALWFPLFPLLQADAIAQAQQVQITGPLPNIATYCIYGNGVATPRTLKFNATFKAGEIAELPTASTNTTGDQVVAFASLSLCDK
jgi:hypothetical protein